MRYLWAVTGMALLASCTGIEADTAQEIEDVEADSWFSTTDPETDTDFRCIAFFVDNGYSGGGGMWCYVPEMTP